jgi:hypothetical protein
MTRTETMASITMIRTDEENRPDSHVKQIPDANCAPAKKDGQYLNADENRTHATS